MLRSASSVLVLGAAALLSLASGASTPPPGGPPPGPTATGAPPPAPDGTYRPAQTHRYQGGHPVHPDFGRGYCTTADPHAHDYEPLEPELFTIAGGIWIFIGDPADFEHEGDVYWYANPHPIPGGDEECWCYYPWPHRHGFALDQEGFDATSGIIYWVGEFTSGFYGQLEHKRDFFRRHYPRRYLGGSLYRRHPPRYDRLGPGRYRLIRHARPFVAYRPNRRPGSGPYTHAPGPTSRPGGRGALAGPGRSSIARGYGVRVHDPARGAHRGARPPAHWRGVRPSGARRWTHPFGARRGGFGPGLRSTGRRGAAGTAVVPAPARRSSGSARGSSPSRGSGGSRRR